MSTTRSDGSSPEKVSGDWSRAKMTDLAGWQKYYRTPPTNNAPAKSPVSPKPQTPAADILHALGKYDSAIEELRAASRRPYSRFADFNASDTKTMSFLMSYLGESKACFNVMQVRAVAELAADQPDKALADVKLLLRLNDTLRQEPLLISHLVSLATMSIAMQPIYEGLARHKWSEAQLAELQTALAEKDFLADYQKAMRGERAFAIASLENLRLTREYQAAKSKSGKTTVETMSFRFTPQRLLLSKRTRLRAAPPGILPSGR